MKWGSVELRVVVWHNASDEVGIGGVEGGQQGIKLGSEGRGHGFESLGTGVLSLLLLFGDLLRLSWMVSEKINHKLIVTLLQLVHNRVVALILVLCQPVSDVVVDDASVVSKSKVGVLVLRAGLLLQEGRRLPKQILLQFILKGLVGCLGEHGLFFKNGHQTHGFFHALDSSLEIHAEVDHLPLDALPDVLLLLQHKHMVVKKLLELFVTEVDADLLERVEFEDLKTCNVEDANEVDFLHCGIDEGPVAEVDKPKEEPVVHGSGQGSHGVEAVVRVLPLVHPLGTDLDLGTDEVAVEELPVLNEKQLADVLTGYGVVHLAALFTALLLEGHLSEMGNRGCKLEGVVFFLSAEAEGVKSNIRELQFLGIVDGVYLDLSLREEEVVIGVRCHEDQILQTIHDSRLDKLEEDVVAALVGLLVSHTGLLKQIDVNEATGQLSHVVEVDPDELTEPGGVVIPDGLGIAIRLKDWVGVHNPVLQIGFFHLIFRGVFGFLPF